MKKYLAILNLPLLILAFGCSDQMKDENGGESQIQESKVPEETSLQHSENNTIELNNGAKWIVVPEMLRHIRNMESDIILFSETEHIELLDFTQLAESLQKNIELLTASCTMEGKAHEELHKWLLPYIDLVDRLNKSKSTEEAMQNFENIKSSYATFNTFFE